MRGAFVGLVVVALAACEPPPGPAARPYYAEAPPGEAEADAPAFDPATAGVSLGTEIDFAFDGGRIEVEERRIGERVIELVRNRYAVPMTIAWEASDFENLEPLDAGQTGSWQAGPWQAGSWQEGPPHGVVVLPAAPAPNGVGVPIVLTTEVIDDPREPVHRTMTIHARFGDPSARPQPYVYRLPYKKGQAYTVLQGPHGAFSHRGSNEYAVDFACPVATAVLAARGGIVVASNAAASGHGTTAEFLEPDRVNFVLILHDDGTLGEYMHLSPSGVEVQPGQRVERGDEIALSGNTGFSTTPHLHFQVMTAADDGIAAQSFPWKLATRPGHADDPVTGATYSSWE